MQAQSRAVMFGLSTALAVAAIGFLAWRAMEQSPSLFASQPSVSSPSAPLVSARPTLPASEPASAKDVSVSFDVVSVEPDGSTVVAGRTNAGAQVQLLNNGVVIASVKADMNGQFAIVPLPLPTGHHLLSLVADGKPASPAQTVAVALPARGQGDVVVALTQPGVPTRILSDTIPSTAPTTKAPAPVPSLAIRSVEADDAGGFYATGTAAPGAAIRLSLNGAPIANIEAGADGRWSLKIQKGMAAGAYSVRAEHLDPSGKVIAQADVPFDYPARSSANSITNVAPSAAPPPAQAATPAHAVVPEVQSVTVQRGDSLWKISQRMLGSGYRYTQIYAANSGQIRDPSLIFPEQILVVPGAAPSR